MSNTIGVDANQDTFPPADIEGELNPAANKNDLKVDSVSAQLSTSKALKEKAEEEEKLRKKKENEDKEAGVHTLKSALVISGVIVAVIGAIFAVTKKLKET